MVVGTNDYNTTAGGIRVRSKRVYPHPGYQDPGRTWLAYNDIALVEVIRNPSFQKSRPVIIFRL
jgi:hypothetical protein